MRLFSLSYDNVSEHFDILSIILLIICGTIEPDNPMPHIEAAHIYACEQSEPGCSVFLGQPEAVPPPCEEGGHCGERDEGGEECTEAGLGLPDAELIVVVVQIRLFFYLLCFLVT